MSSRRQQRMRQGVNGSVGMTSTQPATVGTPLAAMTEMDVIQAELAGLEQGMLQLRLQQQEAAQALEQINNAIQQQAGAITAMQRLAQTMQQRAAERSKAAKVEVAPAVEAELAPAE